LLSWKLAKLYRIDHVLSVYGKHPLQLFYPGIAKSDTPT
jgi:hypothetical protein